VKLEEQEKGSAENAGAIQQNRGNEKEASVPIAGDGASAEQHNDVNLEGQTQKDPQAGGGCRRRNPEHVKTDSQRIEKRQDQYGAPDERSFCFQHTREKKEGSGEPHGTKCLRKDIAKPKRKVQDKVADRQNCHQRVGEQKNRKPKILPLRPAVKIQTKDSETDDSIQKAYREEAGDPSEALLLE